MSLAEKLMQASIVACRQGIAGLQSPFGAVIARRDGGIVAAAHNVVRSTCDATAHAEVNAIRLACRAVGSIDLSGHVIATTCEPCPMCAAAIHWARLETVYFGADIEDARRAGFNELAVPCRKIYELGGCGVEVIAGVLRDECRALFDEWRRGPNPVAY